VPFIFSAWLKSYRNNAWAKNAPNTVYFKYHHELIERILKRSAVLIAHPEDDADQILGFAVFEERNELVIAHYVYVKQPYRRMNIASELLNAVPRVDFFTHLNGRTHPALTKHGAVYNPYLFFL
jgi:GNAT superfamily N-acetyltransferase